MGSSTSHEDVPPTENQSFITDVYEDEDPPTDDNTATSPSLENFEEAVSPTHNEVAGNIPEGPKLLMPEHTPLEHVNWEVLCNEDQKKFKETQNNENENGYHQTTNGKIKATTSAMSRWRS